MAAIDADVWMVELAALRDPEAVTDAFVLALGVPDREPAAVSTGWPTTSGAAARVLVLDNCEHVISEAARVTEHLLHACPELRVVATSREALGIGGEALWPVPRIVRRRRRRAVRGPGDGGGWLRPAAEPEPAIARSAPDSMVSRSRSSWPRRGRGASRSSSSSPGSTIASASSRAGTRTAMPRQQTLRAVVEWSYDLLFADEQQVFDRLSVFAGGCTLEAAEAVCAGGEIDADDVADVLPRLVDKSLVIADRSGGQVRFYLLQTLTLFGRERLAASDDADLDARSACRALQGPLRGRVGGVPGRGPGGMVHPLPSGGGQRPRRARMGDRTARPGCGAGDGWWSRLDPSGCRVRARKGSVFSTPRSRVRGRPPSTFVPPR